MTGTNPRPALSVVLPAYDEAESLGSLLPRLRQTLDSLGIDYEVVVVDAEGGTADTAEVCAANGARYARREGGPEYGAAIRTAQILTSGEYVVIMDADGSHAPEFVSTLWAARRDTDIVIASRYVRGGQTENPKILIFMSWVVNVGFRIVLGLDCHDVSNSFRLYRGADFRGLTLECKHFDIVEEILVKLCELHRGYRLTELPFTFERRKAGRTKRRLASFAVQYVWTLVRLRRLQTRARRGGYHA
jgi:dolichol-phosphate mannosyltransferase